MRQTEVYLVFLCAVLAFAQAPDCTDGACSLPSAVTESVFSVLPPVPETKVSIISQAARLDSLSGKTIAIIGGSFMASVTHPELKRLILSEYPNAKVYLLSEIGSAGPYPRPGVIRHEKDDFQRRLKDCHVDAVISGNGGCGLCTPKETGSCIAAEVLGIPSVMIAAPGFVEQAKNTAYTAGIETLRVAEYPGAFASHTHDELIENTRQVLWPQIKKALTTPIDASERMTQKSAEETLADLTGSLQQIQQMFQASGWTDGLPIIPPTQASVAEFLKFTDLPPDKIIGEIPPAQRAVTVRHVAVNGVMSGCPPEFMPILLAFVEAMKDGNFRRPLISTHGWTPFCWLNGPVFRQLGFDCEQGEISSEKNAVLGRFINLAMLNLGGYSIKHNRMGTFGYLMPWCLAENDAVAVSLGWKPYNMQCGYALNESTITAASAINWGNNLVPASSDAARIKDMIAWDAVEKQQMAVGSGMPCVNRTFLITPEVARNLASAYPTKDALEDALITSARIPLDSRAFANYWGNPGSSFDVSKCPLSRQREKIAKSENATSTATPPWLAWIDKKAIDTVPAMQKGKSAFLVTGDTARNKEMCLPGGGSATIKISLPKNWDELTAKLGYRPIKDFYLTSTLKPDAPRRQQHGYHKPGSRGDVDYRRMPFPPYAPEWYRRR